MSTEICLVKRVSVFYTLDTVARRQRKQSGLCNIQPKDAEWPHSLTNEL
jgi:hypothetical protein